MTNTQRVLEQQAERFRGLARVANKVAKRAYGYGGAEEDNAYARGQRDAFEECAKALDKMRSELGEEARK